MKVACADSRYGTAYERSCRGISLPKVDESRRGTKCGSKNPGVGPGLMEVDMTTLYACAALGHVALVLIYAALALGYTPH